MLTHAIEKIMAKNSGRSRVSPGESVPVKVDFAEINKLYLQTVYARVFWRNLK